MCVFNNISMILQCYFKIKIGQIDMQNTITIWHQQHLSSPLRKDHGSSRS